MLIRACGVCAAIGPGAVTHDVRAWRGTYGLEMSACLHPFNILPDLCYYRA